ncbi:MAG: response regulator [Deltaproteobacteria bacterium]|nr:response regulator [Deltaproteobacteria bacterium]
MSSKVLFVDDEPHVTEALKRALRKEPYEVLSAGSARDALRVLSEQPIDVVVSDERMPGMSGSEFLAQVADAYPDTIRIILTGHATMETAVRAINEGRVYRFMTKPVNEMDLVVTIRRALQHKEVMIKAAKLEKIARQQRTALEDLERRYPGITSIKTDAKGTIVLDDEG